MPKLKDKIKRRLRKTINLIRAMQYFNMKSKSYKVSKYYAGIKSDIVDMGGGK